MEKRILKMTGVWLAYQVMMILFIVSIGSCGTYNDEAPASEPALAKLELIRPALANQ